MQVRSFSRILATFCLLFVCNFLAIPQATVSTGSIQGTVSDPSGAAVAGAKVTITNKATGQASRHTANGSGDYTSGALTPGDYQVRIEQPGFSSVDLNITVQVGGTANGNTSLTVGKSSEVVEVTSQGAGVNVDQATVQGVLTSQQIDNLPINGRNFLDLAQLEPGVQIQDGTNFDPTKVGFSSISFGGRFGRTARISVDGVDISDETVGTTTTDIPASGIQEFQLSQSNLDLSNDLTSSGAVNVITRSGSNEFHGELFYLIRDSRWGAELPHPVGIPAPYQRNQFGGRFGGPIIKDKLFFFLDFERTKQDEFVPVVYASPFTNFNGGFGSPFRENEPQGRLDWQPTSNLRVFFRFNYFSNLVDATFFSSSYQVYGSKNYSRQYVAGADYTTGSFTHTVRFSELHFQNNLTDQVTGSGLPLSNIGVNLDILDGPQTGVNILVPQATPQRDTQAKYDGGKPIGTHFIRFGFNYNRNESAGFASFFQYEPRVRSNRGSTDAVTAAAGPFPGGASNPLNYPVETVAVGNGLGYSTENAGLGYPAGLLGPDNRLGAYIGDTWKIRPNLTMNYGVRWVRDTGRTDSDLPAIPALNALQPGAGDRVRQPNANFAPQIGFAWDPRSDGKTVLRIGAGIFYENVIYNNVLFDRPLRLPTGAFFSSAGACAQGSPLPLGVPGGTLSIPASLCSGPIGLAASGIAAFEKQYQAANPFSLATPNPNYLVPSLQEGLNVPLGLFAPDYQTPRSLQMNAGFQHEFGRGTILSVDYLRNITTHSLLGVDTNHVGDVRYFNKGAAQAAIATTLTQFKATTIDQAIANGATMADFAGNGLTSPAVDFGGDCSAGGVTTGCAFPGINPNAGAITLLQPIGRSVYNGLDVKLTQNIRNPLPGIKLFNLQVAYSLSRYVTPGGTLPGEATGNSDGDFVIAAIDNAHPLNFTGPSLLDRTHQLSFGLTSDLPGGFRSSIIGHFYSGLPVSLEVPNTNDLGEIFRTDFTGDGSVSDLLPGTNIGSYNRDVSRGNLASVIQNYNSTVAGQPTPAGQVLINNGLFTLGQLQALGGVAPSIPAPVPGEVGISPLRAFDFKLSWIHRFRERFEIEPNVGFYNLFNFTNYDLPPNVLTGALTGSAGSVNGTTQADRITNRVGLGTGVFSLGSPRQIEFGMRVSF